MGLPTSKVFIPGFRLIADDAGSYIDDVSNLRLGPEFVLTRNTADPSASISVAQYIEDQIAAGIAAALPNSGNAVGRVAVKTLIARESISAASSFAATWAANAYRELAVTVRGTAAANQTIAFALHGVAAGYSSGSVGNDGFSAASTSALNVLVLSTTFGLKLEWEISKASGDRICKIATHAPTAYGVNTVGGTSDTTSDCTGIDITFPQATTALVEVWGVPA